MSKLAQGTQLYFIDSAASDPVIVEVDCPTGINLGGNPADQLDDTCLGDRNRQSKPGLRSPGQATINLNTDDDYDSHMRIFELSQMDENPVLKWALGWSNGTDAPTLDSNDDFNLPGTRTWTVFQGYISDFPKDFQGNSLVTTPVSVQRSGGIEWIKKTS